MSVTKRVEIDIPEQMYDELVAIAERIGIRHAPEAALIAIGDWIARRRAELDDRDPGRKYFVNEALDELEKKNH